MTLAFRYYKRHAARKRKKGGGTTLGGGAPQYEREWRCEVKALRMLNLGTSCRYVDRLLSPNDLRTVTYIGDHNTSLMRWPSGLWRR